MNMSRFVKKGFDTTPYLFRRVKMKKFYSCGLAVFCALLGLFFIQPVLFHGTSSANTPAKTDIRARLQRISVPFVANQGQTDKQVKFYAATFGGTVFVTDKGEIVYSLPAAGGERSRAGAVIKEKPLNAKRRVVFGEERAKATVNYFKGNDKTQWKKNLPTYDVVSLGEVFTGVDLKLRAYGSNVEKLFYVRPQAEPGNIAMTVEGAQHLKVNKQGELEVVTAQGGPVKFTKPVAYQEINGKRVEVAVAYAVHNSKPETRNSKLTYGFTVGPYDKTKELVIDPLLASTYLGGTQLEGSSLNPVFAMSIAVAPNGDIYVAGFTDSVGTFPTTAGSIQGAFGGVRDAFVSRFDRGLTNLAASTYLGGSGTDAATSLAIDSAGNVYVAGHTNSTDFPSANSLQRGGDVDAFVAKLNATLSTLSSTYLGGAGNDQALALFVDSTGVYVGGATASTNFPVSAFPWQLNNADPSGLTTDAFLAKFNANSLTTPSASTYLGGGGNDSINAMAVRGANIYVTGDTSSALFPTISPIQTFQGGIDCFVAKLNTTLDDASLLTSTYLGGAGDDHAYALAINTTGDIFVAGDTTSSGLAIAGVYNTIKNAGTDAFAAKLDANLSSRILTYLGGSGEDHAYSLAISGANVYVAGDTTSTDFPTIASYDTTPNGFSDTFITKLNDTLTALSASTYLGGSNNDFANAVALDIFGNIYLTGFTFSGDLPTSATAYQTSNVGLSLSTSDAFISEFDANLSPGSGAPDTIAPSVPTNLTAAAASDTRITLLWTASTDNVGVVGYEVWRDGAKIAIATTNSYSDTGLSPSTTYTYTVKAFDAANNTSAASSPASATTLALGASDTEPPTAPANLTATAASDTRISLLWTASTDNVGVSGYDVYRGTTKIATITTTSYSDGGLTPSTSYTYTVKAVDGNGNVSADSNAATAATLGAAAAGGGGGGGGGGCFIATAAYGSYMADDVMVLRRFRDDYLLTNAAGRAFVNLYYTWSPPVANFIAEHETARTITRAALSPLVYGIKYPVAGMVILLLIGMGGTAAILRRRRVNG
jgi:chitodextrinase